MITGFIVLLVCQLVGEFAVRALGVSIPGRGDEGDEGDVDTNISSIQG